jgi:hypothetical protein|tara:strand:+ start:874 stop:1095 length:222 start_codon:yes stop_codon:yes gene_type:complete
MNKKSHEELSVKALELQIKNQPTLRDLFAMAVLQGFMANPEKDFGYRREHCTDAAYAYADEMLKSRKKKILSA